MKYLLACLAFAVALSGQTTTITDTLSNAQSQHVSGLIQLDWAPFTALDGTYIAAGRLYVDVTKGALSIALVPTDTATPAGASYTATYAIQGYIRGPETWHVCTSATPITIAAALGLAVCGGGAGVPSWATTTSISWAAITSTTWAALVQ